ncbi:MAG: hypothetical protein MUE69_30610 [Myxococcota bacterium]|nr:hypothetical protein [Myxococcota bacterium]
MGGRTVVTALFPHVGVALSSRTPTRVTVDEGYACSHAELTGEEHAGLTGEEEGAKRK